MSTGERQFDLIQLSPASAINGATVHTGMIGYGWVRTDPLTVTVKLSLALGTFDVHADNFPNSLGCSGCQAIIQWGGFACDGGQGMALCLRCGHERGRLNIDEQYWTIGLALFVNMMEGSKDDVRYMPGEVQVYRAASGEVILVLSNKEKHHSVRIVAPYSNMKVFLTKMADFRERLPANLERMYIESGVNEVEKWMNEVS